MEWSFSEPRELFDDSFLAEFEVAETALEGRVALSDPTRLCLADARGLCLKPEVNSVVYVDECFNTVAFAGEPREVAKARFRAGLNEIGWSPTAQGIVALVSSESFPQDYSALHVRAGDIVSGDWRQFVPVEKYIPTPYVEFAIQSLSGSCSDPIWVLSDNERYGRYLKSRFSQVRLSSDFFPGYSDLTEMQRAFADNLALSRARRIIGPKSSAFSRLGAQLGGITVQSIEELTTEDNAKRLLRDGIDRGEQEAERTETLRPLVARDICWYHDVFLDGLSTDERIRLAQRAVDAEPDFCGALNRSAAALALAGRYDEAKSTCARALDVAAMVERHADPLVESLATSVSTKVLNYIGRRGRARGLLAQLGDNISRNILWGDDERSAVLHDLERKLAECKNLQPFQVYHSDVLQNLQFQIAVASWLSNASYRLSRIVGETIKSTVNGSRFLDTWRPTGFRKMANEGKFPQVLRNLEVTTVHLAHAIGAALSHASPRRPVIVNLDRLETCPSGLQWVHGWAHDTSAARCPSAIGYLHNNSVVSGGTIALARPDVAAALNDPLALNSGFALPVPRAVQAIGDVDATIRVF